MFDAWAHSRRRRFFPTISLSVKVDDKVTSIGPVHAVPAEGALFSFEGKPYKVHGVAWEAIPNPASSVRLGVMLMLGQA